MSVRPREEAFFDETVRTRRSVRSYADEPVSGAVVLELLDLARCAPSSVDGQPWEFVVVRDPTVLASIVAAKNRHCAPSKRDAYPADFVASAPVVVAVCVDKNRSNGRERENGIIAAAYLQLAAQSRGLSGVYLTAYQPDDDALARELAALLTLPEHVEAVALIPLGYPAHAPAAKTLRPLAVHYESYGRTHE